MAPCSELDTTLGELRAQLRAAGSPAGSDLDCRAWQVQLDAVEAGGAGQHRLRAGQGAGDPGQSGLIPAEHGPWEVASEVIEGIGPVGWVLRNPAGGYHHAHRYPPEVGEDGEPVAAGVLTLLDKRDALDYCDGLNAERAGAV